MSTRTLRAVMTTGSLLAALVAVATNAVAAAFFIPVHDFRLGTCADGSPCQWDCGQEQVECADGSLCRISAQGAVSGALVVRVTDAADAPSEPGCDNTSGGSVVETAFRVLGEPSTLASGKVNVCGQNMACGCDIGPGGNACALCPTPDADACGPAQFLCHPEFDGFGFADFAEEELQNLQFWLDFGRQPLGSLLETVPAPFATGTALVYQADSGDVDDQTASSQPSVGRYCVRVLVTQASETICDPQDVTDCSICTPEVPTAQASALIVGDGDLAACPTPACGDGVLDPSEECDDGDTDGGDGCSATCAIESCHVCVGSLGSTSSCSPAASGAPCDADANACTIDLCDGSGQCDPDSVITVCTNGDGCCPAGCTPLTDDDCSPPPVVTPWSSSGGLLVLAAALLLVGLLAVRRSLRLA